MGESTSLPDRGTRCVARRAVLPHSGFGIEAELRRQRGGATLSRRRVQRDADGGVVVEVRVDVAAAREAAREVHRSISQLRHQLQPRQGSGAAVRRTACGK